MSSRAYPSSLVPNRSSAAPSNSGLMLSIQKQQPLSPAQARHAWKALEELDDFSLHMPRHAGCE